MEDLTDFSPPSKKHRRRKSINCCCCFPLHNHHHQYYDSFDSYTSASVPSGTTTTGLSRPISTIRSGTHEFEFSEFKDKCRSLFSRFGNRRRSHSTDFSYDSLSYALNFDDQEDAEVEQLPIRNFSDRLPLPSPPPPPKPDTSVLNDNESLESSSPSPIGRVSKEISACG